ncbi:MAG: ABC transporter ATP-binding protein [Clostridiaceae bacterium]|nr:ABC transporter ATP-binding protein [Clostridiaceae bacterium]
MIDVKKILSYLKPYTSRMIAGITIKFTGTIMDLLLPWILSYTIDDIVPLGDVTLVFIWGGIMLLCAAAAFITNVIANRMASRVARNATQAIRHDLFEKISYLSCKQVDEFTIPSLQSRLTSDTYNIHHMIGMMQRLAIRAPILLLGGILVTLGLEPVLSLILILTLPFMGLLIYFISKKGIPLFTEVQKSVDKLVRTVRENIAGIRVIKALSKTEYEKRRFERVNTEVVENESRANTAMALTNPAMNLILNLGLTLVIIAGAFRINAGLTRPGEIIAFLTYFTIILNAMLAITRLFVIFTKGTASAERIRQVLDAGEELALEPENHMDDGFHITFEHVAFSYHARQGNAAGDPQAFNKAGKNSLEDISFTLRRGETLGIIGGTGSGKSTIIRLLLRLYDPTEGVIRISGDDIRGIPQDVLHTKFGVVFQNDVLFADTIASNISFGRSLSREQLKSAAVCAQASEFIDSLKDGYDHMLSTKSANLSGGQKQRVLIARALAAKPEILILDDSSSALDYKTDSLLRRALNENMKDTTTILIAQRISSIMHADHILVLEDGKALGYGTHKELLEKCSEYHEIYASQMGDEAVV